MQNGDMLIFFLKSFRKVIFRKIHFLKDGVQTVVILSLTIVNSCLWQIKLFAHARGGSRSSGRGFISIKRGFVFIILPDFQIFSHKNEIIWPQRGDQANHPNLL